MSRHVVSNKKGNKITHHFKDNNLMKSSIRTLVGGVGLIGDDVTADGAAVVGEAVTSGTTSTTTSTIATTLGSDREIMVWLYTVVNSSVDGERKSIESVGQKHWFESSKTLVLLVSARDRPKCRLKASLNNLVPVLQPRQIPVTRNTNLKVTRALLLVCSFRRKRTAPIAVVKLEPSATVPMIFTSATLLNSGSH